MSKVVTKTGDKGYTSLYDGTRVPKDDYHLDLMGDVDELISYLGVFKSSWSDESKCIRFMDKILFCRDLENIQAFLFRFNEEIASEKFCITNFHIDKLDQIFEKYYNKIPPVTGFVYPDHELDIARCICRRVERKTYTYYQKSFPKNPEILKFINRLSDVLYVIARFLEKERKYINEGNFF